MILGDNLCLNDFSITVTLLIVNSKSSVTDIIIKGYKVHIMNINVYIKSLFKTFAGIGVYKPTSERLWVPFQITGIK